MGEQSSNAGSLDGICKRLELYRSRNAAYVESRIPLEQFTSMQLALAASSFCNCSLDAPDETATNIVCFIAKNIIELFKRIEKMDFDTWKKVQSSFKQLFNILEDLAPLTKTEDIGWNNIFNSLIYGKMFGDPNIYEPKHVFYYYIPSITHFERKRLLGYGGFASAYLVRHRPSDFECCIKIISRKRLSEESKMELVFAEKLVICSTKSPYLIRNIVSFPTPNAYISVMNVADGGSLDKILNIMGTLSPELSVIIIAQLVQGIIHMHYRGFIHRDIKPSNMLVSQRGHVKVADFDLIKVCRGHYTKNALPLYFSWTAEELHDKETAGTPNFIAPERLQKQPYGRASDWYAVGMTMHKLLVGHVIKASLDDNEFDNEIATFQQLQTGSNHAVSFTVGLLNKNPRLRLGSTSYKDIEEHEIFRNTNLHEIWSRSEPITDKMFSYAVLGIQEQVVDENDPVMMERWQDKDIITYYDVRDSSSPCAIPLYTYVSRKFAYLVEKLAENQWQPFPSSKTILVPRTPPSDPLNFSTQLKSKPVLEEIKEAKIQSSVELVELKLRRETVITRLWNEGFSLRLSVATSSRQFLVVDAIKSSSPASRCGLMLNDVIVSAGKKDGSELKDIPWTVNTAVISVAANNPFRMIEFEAKMLKVLHEAKKSTINIWIQKKKKRGNMFGVTTVERKVWNGVGNDFIRLHIINYVSKRLKVSPQGTNTLLVGDLIIAFNEQSIESLAQWEVDNRLQDRNIEELLVTILETSPLRRL